MQGPRAAAGLMPAAHPKPGAAACTAVHSHAHVVGCITPCACTLSHLALLLLKTGPLPGPSRGVTTEPHLFRARC